MSQTNNKRSKSFLSRLDLFAPEVSLTFQGQRQFKTDFGGCASIITGLIFLSVVMIKFEQTLEGRQTAAYFTTKTTRDVNEELDLAKLGFMFAINEPDPRIGKVVVGAVHWPYGEKK